MSETISNIWPIIVTALSTLVPILVLWRSEKAKILDKARQEAASISEKAASAREEYTSMIEAQIKILREQQVLSMAKIATLEASEQLCQQERVALLAENGALRRRVEHLEARIGSIEKKVDNDTTQ